MYGWVGLFIKILMYELDGWVYLNKTVVIGGSNFHAVFWEKVGQIIGWRTPLVNGFHIHPNFNILSINTWFSR